MEHTPEPWKINRQGICLDGVGIDTEDDSVVEVACSDCTGDDERLSEVNARRIVACVNACRGIPTEALEGELLKPLLPSSARKPNG